MTFVQQRQYYYQQMLDLQERCKKSEEERLKLEEKYNKLVEESRVRHEACINRLRLRYIRFLEEQRARDERNNKLLGALDKVDNKLAIITTKTERLNNLKKQYELEVSKALEKDKFSNLPENDFQNQDAPQDPKIQSKEEAPEKLERKENISLTKSAPFPTSTNSLYKPTSVQSSPLVSPRKLHYSPFTLQSSRLASLRSSKVRIPSVYTYDSNYLPQTFAKTSRAFHERNNDLGFSSANVPRLYTDTGYSRNDLSIPGRSDYLYGSHRRNILSTDNSPRDYKGSDVSAVLERSANLLSLGEPKYTSTPYKYSPKETDFNIDYETPRYNPVETLENKLDRYIQQIRNIHGPEETSADEYEYNTSGDLLNETFSDEGVATCATNKSDLASESRPERDMDTTEEDRGEDKSGRVDEDDAAGAADKFTTRVNVPASDTNPECAPVMDENYASVATPVAEIEETRQAEDGIKEEKTVENVTNTLDNLELDNEEKEAGDKERQLEVAEEKVEKYENKEQKVEKEEKEEDDSPAEDKEKEESGVKEEVEYNYPADYNQEYSAENQEYVQDQAGQNEYYQEYQTGDQVQEQAYDQKYNETYQTSEQNPEGQVYDQQYNQEYQIEDQNQEGQVYDQQYVQDYQAEDPNQKEQTDDQQYIQDYVTEDPNQKDQTYDQQYNQDYQPEGQTTEEQTYDQQYNQNYNYQYENSNQYDTSQYPENTNQQYDYNYEDPNVNTQYENEKYDGKNEQNYTGQEVQGQYQYEENMNGHGYERNDYPEQDTQGYANAEPNGDENKTKKLDNSDSESTIERHTVSNAESDFDFN